MTSAILNVSGVTKTYHRKRRVIAACSAVSFSQQAGSMLGLVGESGSGKSTLANIVLGLEVPDEGQVLFEGRSLEEWFRTDPQGFRAGIQPVFQYPRLALDSKKTIGWSVAEPLRVHGVGSNLTRVHAVKSLLTTVGLEPDLLTRRPSELSGGQLQRVNIARALALSPRLLVCDEPVSSLDVSVQAHILNLFLDIQASQGMAMLFISHDLSVVRHVCDYILVMYGGRIVESGSAEEIWARPAHPYTRELLAAVRDSSSEHGRMNPTTGQPESLIERGCVYRPRCPFAIRECEVEEPRLRPFGQGQHVACIRAEEIKMT